MSLIAHPSKSGSVDIPRTFFDESETIDILGIFGVLWRRKWLILLIACIGTIGGWLYSKRVIPLYTAEAAVVMEPRQLNVLNVQQVLGGLRVDESAVATEMNMITSRRNFARVMEDLKLFDDPEFNPTLQVEEPSAIEVAFDQVVDKLAAVLPNEWLVATGLANEEPPLTALESENSAFVRDLSIENFARNVKANNDGTSYVIRVTFTSEDAEKAARIANRLAEVYVEDQIKNKLFATDRVNSFLEERINAMRDEVQKAEAAVADFKAKNGLLDTRGIILSETQLSDLNANMINLRAELAEKQAKLKLVRDLKSNGRAVETASDVLGNPVIVNLRNQEIEIARKEAELAAQYGPRHPQMVQLQRDKVSLHAKFLAEIDRIAASLENDVRVVQTRLDTIESQLDSIKTHNAQDRSVSVKLAELERQADSTRELYQTFLQRFKETSEQQDIVEPDSRIVSVASPPVGPSTPGRKLYIAIGFTASFMLGSAMALLLDRLDKGVRSPREVERLFGLTTLGMVPRLDRLKRNQKPHHYLMNKPLSAYAEAIRSVYMSIKLGNIDRPNKLVLVTSSLPEEGKTTLAVSLAVFAARSHKKVLLIDLDLRHPSVHRELGWQVASGLVEYMTGDRDLEEVIQHDVETGLDFLPIKAQTTDPTDLIDSLKMRELLELVRQRYDLVIIDSAPIASVTDARALAIMVDKVLFVLQWGETPASVAQHSVQSLNEIGGDIAGVALTRVDLAKHAQYGYGDVGHYYKRSRKYYID